MSPGEPQLLALALNLVRKTYRGTHSDGRKRLQQLLRSFPEWLPGERLGHPCGCDLPLGPAEVLVAARFPAGDSPT